MARIGSSSDRSLTARHGQGASGSTTPRPPPRGIHPSKTIASRLREIIGVVDARRPPGLERFGDDENPALVAETSRYRVYQVRWPVLDGLSAEGLLVQPTGTPAAHIVAVPDAGQTPEQILGLSPGIAA